MKKKTVSIAVGFTTDGKSRTTYGNFDSRQIEENITAFKEEIKSILVTKEAKEFFGKILKKAKYSSILIGRIGPFDSQIRDWTDLSKLPDNFLNERPSDEHFLNVLKNAYGGNDDHGQPSDYRYKYFIMLQK